MMRPALRNRRLSLECRVRPRLDWLEDRVAPAAGMLDPTFSGDGRVTTAFAFGSGGGAAVARDSVGRLIVVGNAYDGSNSDFAVARYSSDGRLDASFDGDGMATIDFGTNYDVATAVAVDSLNRVVVAGRTSNAVNLDFGVARLTITGAPDTTFNGNGKVVIAFDTYSQAKGVAVDSMDRVIVAGESVIHGMPSDDISFAVARLTSAGALDSNFDGDGRITFDVGGTNSRALAVAADSLDRVVVAGHDFQSDFDFVLARLTTSGTFDSSFGSGGRVVVDFGFSRDDVANALAIDSLNRIVVAGASGDPVTSDGDFAVVRLTTAGALDSSFDGDGRTRIDFGLPGDGAYGVDTDPLNRIVVAGVSSDQASNFNIAVARLTTAGGPDASFDGDGRQVFDFGGTEDIAGGVVVDPAGRAVVAGYRSTPSTLEFAVARLTGDTVTTAAQVNDGSVQRSRVTSLTVTFSGQVTFAGTVANAFTFARNGGKPVNFSTSVSVVNGGTVVTLNNFTGTETEFGSLKDGRYTLTALSTQISAGGQALDGDADGTPGGNFVFGDAQGLYRFFGDANGDRHVDIADFGLFSGTFNLSTGQTGFLAAFDFNGDGHIDIADFGQFSLRFFTVLP